MSVIAEKKKNREAARKCFKCGKSPAVYNIKLYRFPKPGNRNMLRCALWARYIFPSDQNYLSTDLHEKLYMEHRMLCEDHFPDEDFTDSTKTRLKMGSSIPSDNGPVSLTLPAYEASQPCPSTEPTNQDPVTKNPHKDHTYSKQEQEHIENPHEDTTGDIGHSLSAVSSRAATPVPPSICRCCLAEGCDKDMTSQYQRDGVEEVYADMLKDTFALEFVAEEAAPALLICDSCVEQLRQASQFKHRTINSATMFQQRVDELNASRADFPEPSTTKRKIVTQVFTQDGNTSTYFPEPVTMEERNRQIVIQVEYEINRFRTAKATQAQATREETIGMCDECGKVFKGVLVATQLIQHKKLEHALPKKMKKPEVKKTNRLDNLVTIVSNSNACPFHWPTEENKLYRCFCCDLHFDELKELRRHFSSDHNMSEFCAEVRNLASHRHPIKLDIADLKCTNCEEPCDDLDILRLHLSHRHSIECAVPGKTVALKIESEGYKCLECQHEFEGWVPLIRHMRVNGCVPMSSNNAECADCGKRFFDKKTLRVHINSIHSENKIYRTTANRANTKTLLDHSNMTIFTFEDVGFSCFSCHETFMHFPELMAHNDTHDSSNAEAVIKLTKFPHTIRADITDLKCNVCQNAFEHIDEFQKHLVESHQVKFLKDGKHYLLPCMVRDGLKCGFCKQSFATSRTLVQHVNSHVGSKTCQYCGKSFLYASTLRQHKLRMHSEIKCALCNITFENHLARRTHNKKHHCGKSLRRKRTQFRCVFCKTNFTSIELKFRHLKEDHGYQSPEFKCAVCNKVFCTDRAYKSHIRCHRRMKSRSTTLHTSLGPK